MVAKSHIVLTSALDGATLDSFIPGERAAVPIQ